MSKIFPYLTDINSYIGAYVKDPIKDNKVNIKKDLVDLDARSLYPTIMLNSNISPENLLFLIPEKIAAAYFIIKDLYLDYTGYKDRDLMSLVDFMKNNRDLVNDYINFVNSNFQDLLVFPFINVNVIPESIKNKFNIEYVNIDDYIYLKFNDPIRLILWIYYTIDIVGHCLTLLGLIFNNKKPGVISEILVPLIENRKKVKNMIKTETDPNNLQSLKILDWAYKMLANSLYGLFGFSGSWLYNILIASSITITGQWFIKYVSKKYNEFNYNLNEC